MQASSECTQLLAPAPVRRQAFQAGQARAVGLAQTQRGAIHRLAHIEFAKRRQDRLDAGEGQGHLQRLPVASLQLHAQLLVIAPLGQCSRREQLRALADQAQEHGQYADALAIDDDTEVEVEPVVRRGLVDLGVPGVDGGQVIGEARVNVDLPALATQLRQLLLDEPDPGFFAGQLEHLRRLLRQGQALAQRGTEAQLLQLLAQCLLGLRLAGDELELVVRRMANALAVALAMHAR